MKSILYVDDANSMRKLVELVIGNDYDLVMAEDGEKGLAAAKQQQFDLVISDINMPNMNGLELLEALRQEANYKFTPILMMTTEASPEMKAKGKALGATGWLVKPFDPQKIDGIIQKVI